ncbi:MAG: hypothetical protein COV44_04680 [Deltaproteobacteria bacterium CG11_big_fil_rev_8_21_14_0_20_45_16]|nr:MAG: hypothetical protein COV44_04680 [Deltaproteobacteria bacterium CG11_big_fil_rev_8_21_14_0_20_45_16]
MNWLTDVSLFALLFFLLVFFHELGHFLMAKWVGIKVEKFSIGMGPAIFSFRKGETEYRLAILPLGGYVKMAGDDPSKELSEEERKRGFLAQRPPAKLLVVFGGPGFNLILPMFIYAIMLAVGIPFVKPVVGSLEKEMPGYLSGLRSGDEIVSIDGSKIDRWKQVEERVREAANQDLKVVVDRVDLTSGSVRSVELSLKPQLAEGRSKFGEIVEVGKIGVSPAYPLPLVYYESASSPLGRAQVQNFDRVLSVDGISILSLDQWNEILDTQTKSQLALRLKRGDKTIDAKLELAGKAVLRKELEILPIELVIAEVTPDGRAAKGGIEAGDRLVAIGSKVLRSWEEVPEIVRASEGRPLKFTWAHNGQERSAEIAAEETVVDDPLLGKDNPMATDKIYRIGIAPRLESDTSFGEDQSWSPLAWIKMGVDQTWGLASMTVIALSKLVTGEISLKLLGSPIMIYKVAGNTYRMAGGGHHGWIAFLTNLALLSITLGLVNLLPVPVLDGGHAVFFTIEWIRGRPVSLKVMEVATQIGLVMLIGLFALVLYNDFNRYGFLDPIIKLFQ